VIPLFDVVSRQIDLPTSNHKKNKKLHEHGTGRRFVPYLVLHSNVNYLLYILLSTVERSPSALFFPFVWLCNNRRSIVMAEHSHSHNHSHHHNHPSGDDGDEANHLNKMAELHANDPAVAKLNEQIVSILLPELSNDGGAAASPPLRVLDFGCGAGRASILLAKQENVASVLGTDISDRMVENANRLLQAEPSEAVRSKVSFRVTAPVPAAEFHPFKGTVDFVVMALVLGHIAPKETGREVAKVVASTLKPGGKFALAEFLYVADEEDKGESPPPSDPPSGREHSHHHTHEHSHQHNHHHHHDHEGETGNEKEKSHHGGHVAYTDAEIRDLFRGCGLEPAAAFRPFEFEWGGVLRKCVLAVGTKQ